MNLEPLTQLLQAGEPVWLRGAPGSGRTHTLDRLARAWPGEVVRLHGATPDWLSQVPRTVLVVVDDAPDALDAAALPPGLPMVASGAAPGASWRVVDVPPLPEDDALALFLRHAPGAGPRGAVRVLVRQLGSHPTAIVAAARRWPEAPIAGLLADPSPGWPGLRSAWEALPEAARETLGWLSALPGPARRDGLVHCGAHHGLGPLIGAGWVRVTTPGTLSVPLAIARAVQPWLPVDHSAYLAWFAEEARVRVEAWDHRGGARAWFRAGLWAALYAQRPTAAAPWLFRGWSLSAESPRALLDALDAAAGRLAPLLRARCATRAHQALGERTQAVEALAAALDAPDADPHHAAFARLELGVAHHRLRHLDAAAACYRAAEAALDARGLSRGRMLALTNLAAIDHDRGRLELARDGYRTAIAEAGTHGSPRLEGIFRSNLGALLLELDQRDDARATLRQAVRCLNDEPDDRLLAITRVNLAAVELLDGHLDAADAHYTDALALLRDEDPATSALCHARRGAVAALRGQLDRSREHHERADTLAPEADVLTVRVVALWRVFLEWAAGDRTSALSRRRRALAGDPPLVHVSDEARLVVRLLERSAGEPGAALLVGAAGAWFRVPGHERVEVARYGAAARILLQLARTAESQPGHANSADTLIDAGWPGERILPSAAKNRLGVALARLRKLGLRSQIQKTRDGWRLDPDWAVVLLRA